MLVGNGNGVGGNMGRSTHVNIGYTYGRLLVIEFAGRNKYKNLLYKCRCSCGTVKDVLSSVLLCSTEPSCGCRKREVLLARNLIHGRAKIPEYTCWLSIKNRCCNKDSNDYHYYGGRGITMCARWLVFSNFYEDMGDKPSRRHTIERINNNKGYCPSNCVWATRKVQSRNKRNVPLYEYNGQKKSVAEWSEITGIHPETIRNRIKRKGWTMEDVLTKPIRKIKGVHY